MTAPYLAQRRGVEVKGVRRGVQERLQIKHWPIPQLLS